MAINQGLRLRSCIKVKTYMCGDPEIGECDSLSLLARRLKLVVFWSR